MSNTIAGVNLAAVAEASLPALQSTFAPASAFMTDFSSDIQAEGASVTTRVPTKPTAADLSSGYTRADVAMTAKTITLDTFYGYVWGFSDVERSKSSIMLNDLFINPALDALGTKFFGDIWNLVVASNFATTTTITAANFDREDVIDLGVTLTDTKKAPHDGRAMLLNPTYYGALEKTFISADTPGWMGVKSEGQVPRVSKFDIYQSDLCDANSANVTGFAFHRSSLLAAARRVDASGASQAGVEVVDVTVPGLNLPVQFRRWYNPDTGYLLYSVGLLYGVAVGNDMGVIVQSA